MGPSTAGFVLALALLGAPLAVFAQGAPVTLRPSAAFAELAPSVAGDAARRLGVEVEVGAVLLEAAPVSLGAGVVGLARVGERAQLFVAGASGRLYVTELGLATDDAATVRALVLALAGLLESAALDPGPVVSSPASEPLLLGPTDGGGLADLADPFERVSFDARPLFELRGRLGLGTQRDVSVAGPGLSVGVLFGPYGIVVDVDTLTPEEDRSGRAGVLSYVFTTVGVGGRFLPLRAGPVRGGVGVSLLLRVGHLFSEALAVAETTFSAGGRFHAEGSVVLADPLSLVLEVGVDVAFNPTKFVRAAEVVFLEDVAVPWVALGLRIAPEP